MSLNGKRDGFTLDDLPACAKSAVMKRGRAETIVKEVTEVVANWREFANKVGVERGGGIRYWGICDWGWSGHDEAQRRARLSNVRVSIGNADY